MKKVIIFTELGSMQRRFPELNYRAYKDLEFLHLHIRQSLAERLFYKTERPTWL